MVSAVDFGSSGPRSSREHCDVFLGKTLDSLIALSTQVCKWVPANLMPMVTLRWTSIPSKGSRKIPSRLMLQELG